MEYMQMGGWAMWLVLLLDGLLLPIVLLVGIGVIAMRVTGKFPSVSKGLAVVTLLACFLPGCAGLLGYWQGASMVDAAVVYADPEQRAMLQEVGYAEAGMNLYFGGGSVCLLAGIAMIGVMVSMTQRDSYEVE